MGFVSGVGGVDGSLRHGGRPRVVSRRGRVGVFVRASAVSGGSGGGAVNYDKSPKHTPLLDTVNYPSDLKRLSLDELKTLANVRRGRWKWVERWSLVERRETEVI